MYPLPWLQVTPESLLLHYNSMRPGLWAIVVGVLKGVSSQYFNMPLQIQLLHSRERGDSDHEVGLKVIGLLGVEMIPSIPYKVRLMVKDFLCSLPKIFVL